MADASRSAVRCATPRCQEYIQRYGERYHVVYPLRWEIAPRLLPQAIARCEQCGGYTDGQTWLHACARCGTVVTPGALVGLFVPHWCQACAALVEAEQRAAGHICRQCHKVNARCYC